MDRQTIAAKWVFAVAILPKITLHEAGHMNRLSGKERIGILAFWLILMFINACGSQRKQEIYVPESSLAEGALPFPGAFPGSGGQDPPPELFVQMGHISGSFSYTNALRFFDSGAYMLSGSGDGTVILWETETGREVRTFRCADDVTHVDVSRDGRYLLTGDMNFTDNVTLWDMATGRKIRSFKSDHSSNGASVLFCDSDRRILAGGGDATIRLWDRDSGQLIREFKADYGDSYKPDVSAMVMTPDGQALVAGYRYNGKEEVDGNFQNVESSDVTIRVWNLETGDQIHSFNKDGGWVSDLAVTPDGTRLLSCDWQKDVVSIWDLSSGVMVNTLPGEASSLAVSAGGRYVLLGGCMNFRLVELATGKEIRRVGGPGIDGWVRSILFSSDGKDALVGDSSSKPMLWDLSSGTLVRAFGGYTGQVSTVKPSRTGHLMLTADFYNHSVFIWDVGTGQRVKTMCRDDKSIMSSATLSPDGTLAATGGWNGRTSNAVIWDVATAKPLMHMELPEDSHVHTEWLAITQDNQYLVWASREVIVISDIATGKELGRASGNPINLDQVRVDPDGRYVIAPSYDKGLNAYALPGCELMKTLSLQDEITCVIGDKSVYAFETEQDNQGRRKRWLVQYDRATLKETGRRRTKDVYGHGGLVYRDKAIYVCSNLNADIFRYDVRKDVFDAALTGHQNGVTGLDALSGDRFLCSSSMDGTVRFWDPETGKEKVRFISFINGEWITITPEGYFNASPHGADFMNVRVGNKVFSIDQFYETYYNPAYVLSVLKGTSVQPADDIRKGLAPPPQVAIVSPESHSEFKDERIVITVSAKDMGGGIDEIRLYHNGKALGQDARGLKQQTASSGITRTFAVTLVGGVNTFRAVGFSRDRTESGPSEITVTLRAPEKKSDLYVLSVGINAYKNPALNLNYAEPDARALEDFFRKNGEDLFKHVRVTGLYNAKATRQGILDGLNGLADTRPGDAVVIYLAGHGENIGETWYFIPHELTYPEREEDIKARAVSSDDLARSIKAITAQKILVLIDACKSGALLVAFRGFEDRKALSQLSRATGVHVMAASTKDQFASEIKTLGHGVFTYTLLEGLGGKAAGTGGTVTVMKLMAYIDETLPELTLKYRQEAQYPVIDSKGMDFPLAKCR